MKVMIIGGGAVSELQHIPAAIELLGKDNVLVAEPNPEQCIKLKAKIEQKNLFVDYKLEFKNVDFVILATPPHLHAGILAECLAASIPVLCEKPLACSLNEIAEVMKLCLEKNLTVGMCHLYRFFPNRNHIKRLIQEGCFGDKITIDIQEGDPADWPTVSGYNFRKELVPGGVLLDAGIHSLDFILWCLGIPNGIEYFDDSLGGLESNAILYLSFENNRSATFRISRTCSLSNKITVNGSANSAELDIFEMNKVIFVHERVACLLPDEDGKSYDWSNVAKHQLADFINAIKNKRQPKCSIQEGADVIGLVEQCYRIKGAKPLPDKAPIPGFKF